MKRLLLLVGLLGAASTLVVYAQTQTPAQKLDAALALLNDVKASLNQPTPPAAVDCLVSWGAWLPDVCTSGTQTRTATITQQRANGGAACPALTEMRPCTVTPPPPPGNGPTVTNFSGTAAHGGSLTVTGARFGSKPTAAPVKYDDFQNLSSGQDLSLNGWKTSGGVHPKASTLKLRPGTPYTKNALAEFKSSIPYSQGGDVSNFYLTGQAFKKGYVDAWIYSHVVSGTPGNQKPIRWHAANAGQPNLYLNLYQPPGNDIVCAGRDGVSYSDSAWCDTPAFYENWRHVQYALDVGSGTSAANGTIRVWVDGALVYDHGNVPVWSGGASGIPELYLGNYLRTDEAASLQNSWEAVYVDNAWARVEIGNAATYAASTHREIQVPTAWADGAITVRVNRGSFATLSGTYLFVVDPAGAISPGFRLP